MNSMNRNSVWFHNHSDSYPTKQSWKKGTNYFLVFSIVLSLSLLKTGQLGIMPNHRHWLILPFPLILKDKALFMHNVFSMESVASAVWTSHFLGHLPFQQSRDVCGICGGLHKVSMCEGQRRPLAKPHHTAPPPSPLPSPCMRNNHNLALCVEQNAWNVGLNRVCGKARSLNLREPCCLFTPKWHSCVCVCLPYIVRLDELTLFVFL